MDRLVHIVNTELALDKLKAEEELERIVNASLTTDEKVTLIKAQLATIHEVNQMIAMWIAFTNVPTKSEINNNNT